MQPVSRFLFGEPENAADASVLVALDVMKKEDQAYGSRQLDHGALQSTRFVFRRKPTTCEHAAHCRVSDPSGISSRNSVISARSRLSQSGSALSANARQKVLTINSSATTSLSVIRKARE